MYRIAISTAVATGFALWGAQAAYAIENPAIALYGETAVYDVLRNGEPVGEHRLVFEDSPQGLTVNVNFTIAIPFLVFTAYDFSYVSRSTWRDGAMVSLDAAVNDDGDKKTFGAKVINGTLRVEGPSGQYRAPLGTFPTDHWNAAVVAKGQVLNTLTGRLNDVAYDAQGIEVVMTGQGARQATRYSVRGQLNTDVWYDEEGRWLKLRFAGKDGSVIDSVCRQCGLAPAP